MYVNDGLLQTQLKTSPTHIGPPFIVLGLTLCDCFLRRRMRSLICYNQRSPAVQTTIYIMTSTRDLRWSLEPEQALLA